MNQIPLLCPRCGRPQLVEHRTDPHHPVRVVHADTGREECAPRPEDGTEPPDPGRR
ncbi:hypothetical protein [Kitasatospora sp. NPDC088134]|uniref:hypothetical protein n=1 Tax=Kitasatospora sp. NPDC088134 TaxID=3364071 RepID=UPI00382D2E43